MSAFIGPVCSRSNSERIWDSGMATEVHNRQRRGTAVERQIIAAFLLSILYVGLYGWAQMRPAEASAHPSERESYGHQ